MSGLDKTGPRGKGSKTGRGLGNCSSKTSDLENKNEHNSLILEENFPRWMRMGKRCAGPGNRNGHRGGQEK